MRTHMYVYTIPLTAYAYIYKRTFHTISHTCVHLCVCTYKHKRMCVGVGQPARLCRCGEAQDYAL